MLTLFKTDWRELWADLPLPELGTVYTKPEIVALILDLAGYDPARMRLSEYRLLEPSCGDGAFIQEVVKRLIASEKHASPEGVDWYSSSLESAIRAVDISEKAVTETRTLVARLLMQHGCPGERANQLSEAWTFQTDFLLHDWQREQFDFVIGNPPYVRLEDVPERILHEYRNAYRTATDRADLYVPFFECGLRLIGNRGVLAFICANRFAKNQYGSALRSLIAEHYHVRNYINLEHTQPFLSDVSAYPAIIVIDRERGAPTHAATVDDLAAGTLRALRSPYSEIPDSGRFANWYPNGAPWVSTCSRHQAQLAGLEKQFPAVEESAPGTKVGIGVATGADDIFVLPQKRADIEDDRQLPLLMAQDIGCEKLESSGHWLLNPFAEADDGSLVNFSTHPGLVAYFGNNAQRLKARHCAKNRLQTWYRTIDRIWPSLTHTPKLVLPDIQAGGVVGFDPGDFYPHHNVYWITSKTWDLRVLQAIFRSSFVTEQIRAHSVSMRGGSLRYQAQNLRRVRIPSWESLSPEARRLLADIAASRDQIEVDAAVEKVLQQSRA